MPTGIYKHKPRTQETKDKLSNENNYNWRGENASYDAVHHWVARWKGTPTTCEGCGKTGFSGHNIHWANFDHSYKRILDDYIRLCAQCHKDYDLKNNK